MAPYILAPKPSPAKSLSLEDDMDEAQLLQEPPSLLVRRLKALTWASRAKDEQLHLLQSRLQSAETRLSASISDADSLRSALLAARAAEERLASDIAEIEAEAMQRALETNRRLAWLESKMEDWEAMKRRADIAEEAEERMAREIAALEAEALSEAMESKAVIAALQKELKGRGEEAMEMTERREAAAAAAAAAAEGRELVASLQTICERLLMGQTWACPDKKASRVKRAEDSIQESLLLGQKWAACPDNKLVSVKGIEEDLGLSLKLWNPSSLVLQAQTPT